MPGFSLEVVEHRGYKERTAIRADDYEELVEKLAAKTGIEMASESERGEPLRADGGRAERRDD